MVKHPKHTQCFADKKKWRGIFANFDNEWLNMQFPSIVCITNTENGGYVCQFGGTHNVGKHTLSRTYFWTLFYTSMLASPDLSRHILTYKFELPTSSFTPDAATLTLHALNCLTRPNTSKCFSEMFQHFQQIKFSISGVLYNIEQPMKILRKLQTGKYPRGPKYM